jgi:hypothetical protein
MGVLRHVALWAFCATVCVLVAACSEKDEAKRIHKLIEEGVSLAEDHDLQGLIKLTAEDFLARPGKQDRAQTRSVLAAAFFHYRRFRIHYPQPSVRLSDDGQTASTRVHFLLVREERSYPELKELYYDPRGWLERVGENADLYQLDLDLRKERDDWLVAAARLRGTRVLE